MNDDTRTLITFEDAVKLLPEGDTIHTFRQGGFALIGADWPREALIAAMESARVADVTGEQAQAMGHGLAITEGGSLLFIESARYEPSPTPHTGEE